MNGNKWLRMLILFVTVPTVGCASIVSGRHSDVTINSYPPNAHVVIQDRKGKEVASLDTPGQVNLVRGMFWPAKYTAVVEAPGFQPQKVDVKYTVNPWVYGNIVLGGIPGLIVDDATGAMWMPKQDTVSVNLKPLANAGLAMNGMTNAPAGQYFSNAPGIPGGASAGVPMARYPAQQTSYESGGK
jgi:hypothetical protein